MLGWKKWIAIAALASGCIMTDGGTTASGGDGPPLIVRNNSSTKICYIQVTSSDVDTWAGAPDQLGPQETLDPGMSKGWNVPSAGLWDVRLLDCQQNSLAERRITVGAGGGEFVYP